KTPLDFKGRLPRGFGILATVTRASGRTAGHVSGMLRAGPLGSTLVGIAFVLPSFSMVLVVAALYVHFGQLRWIQGAFYGIGAAVIAIIARSAIKLVRTTVGSDLLLWALFAALAVTTAWTESEIVWLFILCGAITLVVKAPPRLSRPSTNVIAF